MKIEIEKEFPEYFKPSYPIEGLFRTMYEELPAQKPKKKN